ncbi:serine/threonine-protein kinase HipA [Microcella alkaliphila]|uniref:Serine/threonine-protein kinase HipA n=1 Tax=Microcella alkaliphila TaxID=279828 RepID=A0A4V6MCA7_9MICO|nr:HipA domain-containing protein [Microcella alkaliphila]RZT63909.1 serine/threonine-protein kinase HipA [Microcella alkaliphila]
MTTITAHLELDPGEKPVDVATLYSQVRRRAVSSSLRYTDAYVANPRAYALEPSLPVTGTTQPLDSVLPRSWADAAPDRWGRTLIERQWRAHAGGAGHHGRDDRDYLLAVSDLTRQGALRFRRADSTAFLADAPIVPPLIELPRLLRASDAVVRDSDDLAAVKELLDAGTGSLGGARPKASVRDGTDLYIAKFPKPDEDRDVMLWESIALTLAERCGVVVPARRLLPVGGRHVLAIKRFDRSGARRIGYISALTLTRGRDGELGDYLTITDELAAHGERVALDLEQLWLRIAVGVALHNTDDHLRNHGFLRGRTGWSLAPAFDINPEPDTAQRHATALGGRDTTLGMATELIALARSFGLSEPVARERCRRVAGAISDWRAVAGATGAASGEVERMSDAIDSGVAALRQAAQ